MIVDTLRHGNSVSIEIKNKQIVAASAELRDKPPKPIKITRAMRKAVSINGKPVGAALTWAISVLNAIRYEHWDDPMITRPLSCQEIASLTGLILKEVGLRGCSKQNISRIEMVAHRKLRFNPDLVECLENFTRKRSTVDDDS